MDSQATAIVTISRKHPADAGHRQILARIDDGPTLSLLAGEARTVNVPPGAHTLHVNNTLFWKKVQFEVQSGEHRHFGVMNVASRLSFGFLAGLGMAPMYLRVTDTGDTSS
jgi:hypothetical protein